MKMRKGFTLVEMLIVVAIIGILAAVMGLGAYQSSLQKSRDGRRKADVEQIRSGLEMYRADVGSYPPSDRVTCAATLSYAGATYISSIPCDPQGGSYSYWCTGGCTGYGLSASLERGGIYQTYNP